jgi:hypothetical protein
LGSGGTNALEASGSVATLTAAAYQLFNFTLVDVRTDLSSFVDLKSRIADAPVSANHIFAGAILTDIRILGALVDVISVESGSDSVRAQEIKIGGSGHGTRLATRTPPHGFARDDGAAAATRSCHRGCRRVETETISVLLVAEVPARVQTGASVWSQTEAWMALAPEASGSVVASAKLARTRDALVNVDAVLAVRT